MPCKSISPTHGSFLADQAICISHAKSLSLFVAMTDQIFSEAHALCWAVASTSGAGQPQQAPDLGQVAGPPGQLLQREGRHDMHGGPAALVQAAPVLVGRLLVARVRERPVHSLCAGAAPAPAAQLVGYALHSYTHALDSPQWQQQPMRACAAQACLFVASWCPR